MDWNECQERNDQDSLPDSRELINSTGKEISAQQRSFNSLADVIFFYYCVDIHYLLTEQEVMQW